MMTMGSGKTIDLKKLVQEANDKYIEFGKLSKELDDMLGLDDDVTIYGDTIFNSFVNVPLYFVGELFRDIHDERTKQLWSYENPWVDLANGKICDVVDKGSCDDSKVYDVVGRMMFYSMLANQFEKAFRKIISHDCEFNPRFKEYLNYSKHLIRSLVAYEMDDKTKEKFEEYLSFDSYEFIEFWKKFGEYFVRLK